MIIETRFDLGQTVWRTGATLYDPVKLPCRFCRGASQVRVTSPNTVDYAFVPCPRCEGRGQVTIAAIPTLEVIGEALIGKIQVEKVDTSVPGFNGRLADEREEERYMISDTGFPSGTVYTLTSLHASLADAQDAVDVQNQAIRLGTGRWKPEQRSVVAAQSFLDHLDVYEHTDEHVAAARLLIEASERAAEEDE